MSCLAGFNYCEGKCFHDVSKDNYKNIKQNKFHTLMMLALTIVAIFWGTQNENTCNHWFLELLASWFFVLNLASFSWNPNNCRYPLLKDTRINLYSLVYYLLQQGTLHKIGNLNKKVLEDDFVWFHLMLSLGRFQGLYDSVMDSLLFWVRGKCMIGVSQ